MQLPASAQGVYSHWWDFVQYAASARDQAGQYSFLVTDLQAAAAEIARAEQNPLSFSDRAGLSSLFGVARTMERAADVLTAADDASPIRAAHVSEVPWSRPLQQQAASPMWQLRAEITYRAPDGSVITTWGTGVFQRVLPQTVGAMRDEAWLQFQRMLSKRDEQKNTGGELLGLGRTYLFSV